MGDITVGAIHGGTKRNIIPEEIVLNVSVRAFSEKVGRYLRKAIERTSIGVAQTAGFPEELWPETLLLEDATPPVYNNEELTAHLHPVFEDLLGADQVLALPASPRSEDFCFFGQVDPPVPVVMYQLGVTNEMRIAQAENAGIQIAPVHDPRFYPYIEKILPTGIRIMSGAVLSLMK